MVNSGWLYTAKQSKIYPENNWEELCVANCGNSIAFDVQVQTENGTMQRKNSLQLGFYENVNEAKKHTYIHILSYSFENQNLEFVSTGNQE